MNGNILRLRILEVLRDRARASLKRPRLADLAETTGAAEEDLIDQLDILDSMGAIKADRMMGGDVLSSITGIGKLMLEESAGELATGATPTSPPAPPDVGRQQWDAFICHASEDKQAFTDDLAQALMEHVSVWYDEFAMRIGDSLRQKIDEGLAQSRFGVVVLSPNFFNKKWPRDELDGLTARESNGQKVILPVWLDIDFDGVCQYSPTLAGRLAARASDGVDTVVRRLLEAMGQPWVGARQTDFRKDGTTEPGRTSKVEDDNPARPRFDVQGAGARTLEADFHPSFTLSQFSGDPVADLQWRIRGPRFQGMDLRNASGGDLDRAQFTGEFNLSKPPGHDDFVQENEMVFEVRFRWRGVWRSEIHSWPITRRDLGNKVLWDIREKNLPPLLVDDSTE